MGVVTCDKNAEACRGVIKNQCAQKLLLLCPSQAPPVPMSKDAAVAVSPPAPGRAGGPRGPVNAARAGFKE